MYRYALVALMIGACGASTGCTKPTSTEAKSDESKKDKDKKDQKGKKTGDDDDDDDDKSSKKKKKGDDDDDDDKSSKKKKKGDDDDDDDEIKLESTGVDACDDYLKLYKKCVVDPSPKEALPTFKKTLENMVDVYKKLGKQLGKKETASKCEEDAAGLKKTIAKCKD